MSNSYLEQDQLWMAKALELAAEAETRNEVPVGAVLVKDNQLIATGFNLSVTLSDPTAHAEIQCLRQAGIVLNNYRLLDTTMYVTLEPCAMCAGAMVHSRINRLVYGAKDPKSGAAGSVMNLVNHLSLNHKLSCTSGVLETECMDIISHFFKRRRREKKAEKLLK